MAVSDHEQHRPPSDAVRFLDAMFRDGDVIELRLLGVEYESSRGYPYFKNQVGRVFASQAANAVSWLNAGRYPAITEAIYVVANPVALPPIDPQRPGLFPVIRKRDADAQHGTVLTAEDADAAARRWLIIDIDPERPTGVCATDAEKAAAREVADRVLVVFRSAGWPAPLQVDSGSGYHLYYPLPGAAGPYGSGANDLPHQTLRVLAKRLYTDAAKIDTKVSNPARLMRLPGSWNRKGANTAERPHRRSGLIDVPAGWPNGWASLPHNPGDGWFDQLMGHIDPGGVIRAEMAAARAARTADVAPYFARLTRTNDIDPERLRRRVSGYLRTLPPGIQGQNGNGATFWAATVLVYLLDLSRDVTLEFMANEYNQRCVPPWSEDELEKIIKGADTKAHDLPRGSLMQQWLADDDAVAEAVRLLGGA